MVQVVGIEKVDYVSRKKGNRVTGHRLHCLVDSSHDMEGQAVEVFFISARNVIDSQIGSDIVVGGFYDFFYNRFGDIEDFRQLNP